MNKPNTSVVNLKISEFDVYIGRQGTDYHFGNPFSSHSKSLAKHQVSSRKESIKKFEEWLDGSDHLDVEPERREWILNNLHLLEGKILGCFCKPRECHGDIYIKLINANSLITF